MIFGFGQKHHRAVRRRILAGIIGTGHGVGVTHTALAIANCLASFSAYRVAFVEVSEHSSIIAFLSAEPFMLGANIGYGYKGVDYFPAVREEGLSRIFAADYDVTICDLGAVSTDEYQIADRFDELLIIGSLRPWRYEEYRVFMRDFYIRYDMRHGSLFGLYLKEEERRRFKEEFDETVHELPYLCDPFKLEIEDIGHLRKMTEGWL